MKIKNIQELKSKKEQLKAEISEIESVLSFENPRKSFGVITDGISEKYLGSFLDSNLANKISGKFIRNFCEVWHTKVF